LVRAGIAVSTLPLIGGTLSSAFAASRQELRDVLVDERCRASRAFGERAGVRGVVAHAGRGDWSLLWSTQLDRAWRARPAAIAGVTSHGALFTFQHLAQPRGMRPIFVAELRRDGKGAQLRASGAAAAVARAARAIDLDDDAWGAEMAEILLGLSSTAVSAPERPVPTTIAVESSAAAKPRDPVYAWMIAPDAHAARFV
jgi:hypothetical protein